MEWISVKDRLPKKAGQYWCYDQWEAEGSGYCTPWVDWFDESDFFTTAVDLKGRQFVIKDYSPTHWEKMILPDPPLDLKSSPPDK